ncbi:hypothetical protein BGZ74_010670 [Mortierella antarctica]|nr:hypothetical protein BGZ74_010670 [Mortierella antarctica]
MPFPSLVRSRSNNIPAQARNRLSAKTPCSRGLRIGGTMRWDPFDMATAAHRSLTRYPSYSNDSYPGRDWGGRSQFTDDAGPGDESDDEDDLLMDEYDDFNEPDEDSWQPSFLKQHRRDTGQNKSLGGDPDDDEFTPSGMVGIPQEMRALSGSTPRHHPHRAASFDLHAVHRPQQHQAPLASSYHHNHGQGPGSGSGPGLPSQGQQELRQYPDAPLPMAHHPNGHLIHGRHPIHNRLMMGGFEYPRYTAFGSNAMTFAQPKASHHGYAQPVGIIQRSASSGLDYGTFTRQAAVDDPQVDDPPDERQDNDVRQATEEESSGSRMDQDEVEHEPTG